MPLPLDNITGFLYISAKLDLMKKLHWKTLFKRTPSGTAIVLGNVYVIVCAIVFRWELYPLVLLYWLENGVIGAINIVKMITNQSGRGNLKTVLKLLLTPFFCFHYFGFWAAHGIFVFSFFGREASAKGMQLPDLQTISEIVVEQGLLLALLGVVVSHTFSLITNYYRNGLYKRQVMQELMGAPYARVAVLHIFIIAAGFIVQAFGAPHGAILLLALMKTAGDLIAHNAEHSKKTEELRDMTSKAYELIGDKPSSGPDAFAREHPEFRRDLIAEKNFMRPMKIGCLTALGIFLALVAVLYLQKDLLPRFARLGILFFSVALAIASPFYSYYRRLKCPVCYTNMVKGLTECVMDDLSGMEKAGIAMSPDKIMPKQGWCACLKCKTYFLTGRTSPNSD